MVQQERDQRKINERNFNYIHTSVQTNSFRLYVLFIELIRINYEQFLKNIDFDYTLAKYKKHTNENS